MKRTQEWWDCYEGLCGLRGTCPPQKGLCLQQALQLFPVRHRADRSYRLLSLQLQICIRFFERAQLLIIVEHSSRTTFYLIINPVLHLLRRDENKCDSCYEGSSQICCSELRSASLLSAAQSPSAAPAGAASAVSPHCCSS